MDTKMWSCFISIVLCWSVVVGGIQRHSNIADGKNHVVAGDSLKLTKRDANQYTMEVVVAVDQAMVDYYGDELDDMIMSFTSLASNVYENSNFKQSIGVSLADIIRLPFDPTEGTELPDTKNGKNAQTILVNFCNYMKNSSVNYDAAIYITKALIYNDDKPPNKLEGLSNEKAMCRRDACLILEDSFISTGWVAAHELGHSYGAWHDDESQCADYPKFGGKTIMSSVVGQSWNFSACTQHYFDEFLKDDQSKCLSKKEFPNKLSSFKRNKDLYAIPRQCKEYLKDNVGSLWKETGTDDCSKMWCLRKDGYTQTNGAPWVDGTPCGKDQVCKHLECV